MRALTSVLCTLLFIGLTAFPANAQDTLYGDDAGHLNLHDLDAWFDTPPKLEVNLDGPLLRMMLRASKASEPELSQIFDRLEAIQVRGYEQAGADAMERITNLTNDLHQRGWQTVVRVREEAETVNVMMNATETHISGIVVLIMRPDNESLFVNVAGDIDPEELGRLGKTLNISPLEQLGSRNLRES